LYGWADTIGSDVDTVDSDRAGFASKKAGFWPAMDRQLLTTYALAVTLSAVPTGMEADTVSRVSGIIVGCTDAARSHPLPASFGRKTVAVKLLKAVKLFKKIFLRK
jgi:hypothetical protein